MFSLEFVWLWKKPFVALKKAVSNNVSKSTCSSITCNNSREHFFQMVDVSATTCTIQVIPKLVDAINKLLLCPWLYPCAQKCFQLVPKVFYRVHIWTLRGVFQQIKLWLISHSCPIMNMRDCFYYLDKNRSIDNE